MNISNISIDNPIWLNKARNLLQDVDIASRLTIEITETGAQRDLTKLSSFVNFVQGLGSQIAIDDFGAGYTSFKQLQFLQADIIKIDGMFIRDIVTNYDNRFFVQMMLDCSKTFNMKTVAEFVENGEIAKVLMELDVDYMQGNYFGLAVNYRSWIDTKTNFKSGK
jgi:EAL domain-containing protein (putative c-di-GMP-specific phosphodiesterase class I)